MTDFSRHERVTKINQKIPVSRIGLRRFSGDRIRSVRGLSVKFDFSWTSGREDVSTALNSDGERSARQKKICHRWRLETCEVQIPRWHRDGSQLSEYPRRCANLVRTKTFFSMNYVLKSWHTRFEFPIMNADSNDCKKQMHTYQKRDITSMKDTTWNPDDICFALTILKEISHENDWYFRYLNGILSRKGYVPYDILS